MKYKRFLMDSLINILVAFIPLLILQFIVYPFIAKYMSQDEYGVMIALYSLMYLVGGTLGTELNKERLVKDTEYREKNIAGDFNLILAINLSIAFVAFVIVSILTMPDVSLIKIMALAVACVIIALNSYLEVEFRLELNFIKIAKTQLLPVIGYLVGMLIFYFSKNWIFIFLIGFIFSMLYDIKNTKLLLEPKKRTELFKSTLTDNFHLVLAGALNRILLYGDKLLLLPLGGSSMVSIYYIASLIGKTILMGIEPINTVFLSYLVKSKGISKSNFKIVLCVLTLIGAIGYLVCMALSGPVLRFLYPAWANQTESVLWIITLGMSLSAIGNVINSFVLKECSLKWQGIVNGTTVVVFVVSSIVLIGSLGLKGYCIGVTLAYAVRIVMLIIIFSLKLKINENKIL